MTVTALPPGIERWLNHLEKALRPLPSVDAADVLNEARAHIADRLSQGQADAEILYGFGKAADYAQSFVDTFLLARAQTSRNTLVMIQAIGRVARRSATSAVGLGLSVLCGVVGLGAALCLLLKLVHADRVGLWLDMPLDAHHRYVHSGPVGLPLHIGHDHIVFGYSNPPPVFPEVLGHWAFPLLIVVAVLCYLTMRALLVATLRWVIKDPRPHDP